MKYTRLSSGGQTIIALLIFMMLAIVTTVTAAAVTIANLQANNAYNHGASALANAETGAENALQQLERNPNYTGETLSLPNGSATITVSGTGTKTIVSTGQDANFSRVVTVTASSAANTITMSNWSETP